MGIEIEKRFLDLPIKVRPFSKRIPVTKNAILSIETETVVKDKKKGTKRKRFTDIYAILPDKVRISTLSTVYDERNLAIHGTDVHTEKTLHEKEINENNGVKLHDFGFTLYSSRIRWRKS